ncbi:MAG: cytochrome c biogenesis protein CcsA [Bacteroidetes bacterium]|nr:cytochrome c biogenesis protein CcsA [Bacteroidota bacterium]
MSTWWWKIVVVVLLCYTVIAGFLGSVPALPILHESIRNLYFHVAVMFATIILLTVSLFFSVRHLSAFRQHDDLKAAEAVNVGVLFGILGVLTGSVWAKFTWGTWWVKDAKLNGTVVALLAYFAYMILRDSITDRQKKARISAVYNIFAWVMMLIFLLILPRMTASLHPGSGGNPGFGTYDLSNTMKLVFYPAVAGWTLLALWLWEIRVRIRIINDKILNEKNL